MELAWTRTRDELENNTCYYSFMNSKLKKPFPSIHLCSSFQILIILRAWGFKLITPFHKLHPMPRLRETYSKEYIKYSLSQPVSFAKFRR